MTLEEDIKRLAELRRKKAEIDEEIKTSREAWMDENAGKILAASVAGDLVVEMEEKIRAAVLAASEEEVKATDGVKIRNVKRIEYEEEHAVAWAADNDHYTLLKLKVRDFETVAKKLKPDFVTLTDERQAIISADLSGVLG